jgi:hypothetical protein
MPCFWQQIIFREYLAVFRELVLESSCNRGHPLQRIEYWQMTEQFLRQSLSRVVLQRGFYAATAANANKVSAGLSHLSPG